MQANKDEKTIFWIDGARNCGHLSLEFEIKRIANILDSYLLPFMVVCYFFLSFTPLMQTVFKGLTLFFGIISALFNIVSGFDNAKHQTRDLFAMFIMIITTALSFFGGNSISNSCFLFLFLICAYSISRCSSKILEKGSMNFSNFIYWFICLAFFVLFFKSLLEKEFANIPSETNENYSVYIAFCFFCYSLAKQKTIGILSSLSYGILSGSRAFLFISLFCLALFLTKYLPFAQKKKNFSRDDFALIFLLVFSFSVVLSFFWLYLIKATDVANYRESLNDNSNASRFVSFVYSLVYLLNHPDVAFFGTGNNIFSYLGINENDFYLTTYFYGFRIVQPHNVIINLMVSAGIPFAISYLAVICGIFSRLINEKNWFIPIGAIAYGIVMHSLFNQMYLIFLIVIIAFSQDDYKGSVFKGFKGWNF